MRRERELSQIEREQLSNKLAMGISLTVMVKSLLQEIDKEINEIAPAKDGGEWVFEKPIRGCYRYHELEESVDLEYLEEVKKEWDKWIKEREEKN